MLDSEILVKTDAGRDEIRSRTLGLSMSVRAILLMIDGQRPVSAMRVLIAGSKAPADVLDSLVSQGLIERRGGPEREFRTPAVMPAAPPPPPPPPREPAPTIALASAAPDDDDLAMQLRAAFAPRSPPSAEPLLDLALPTSQEAPPVEEPVLPVVAAPAAPSAYEHLYAMMNEIVRDFLAPHRRYFFQLKIERCGTAEELLELLHALHTSLAKSRGDAFATEVIARLRSAAG